MEFGAPGKSRAYLVALVLAGQMSATAGLLSDYEVEGELVEHVGERLAMLDNNREQVGTLEVTRVEIMRFADVPDEFALAEAEGDLNAEDFRNSHIEYWDRMGVDVNDDTQVVTIYFNLLSREDS